MAEQTVTILKSFTNAEFNEANANTVHPIYSVSANNNNREYTGFITDLRLRSEITSLEVTQLPELGIKDSRSIQAAKLRDYQWATPRYEIDFCLSDDDGVTWLPIFRQSLKAFEPFQILDLLGFLTNNPAYAIGQGITLGIQCIDAGYGFPQAGDRFILSGVVREEIRLTNDSVLSTATSGVINAQANINQTIAQANTARKGLIIQNTGTSDAYVNFQGAAILGVEGIKLTPNAAYEINLANLYLGEIYANSDQALVISITEFE